MLVATLSVLAVLAVAPASSVVTRQQAEQIALRVLHPGELRTPVVVFGLGAPLPRGTVIVDGGPSLRVHNLDGVGLRAVGSQGGTATRLPRAGWLFWEDLVPGALFTHPSVLLVVDAATGRVTRLAALAWAPQVNGRPPAFLTSREAYTGARYRIYAKSAGTRRNARRTSQATAAAVTRGGECVLVLDDVRANGDSALSDIEPNFRILGRSTGLPVFIVHTPDQLAAALKRAARGTPPCSLATVVIAGHGYAPKIGLFDVKDLDTANLLLSGYASSDEPQVQLHDPASPQRETPMTASRLRAILTNVNASTGMNFNVVVQSCFAGRWGPGLDSTAGVTGVLTSSNPNTVSYRGTLDAQYPLRAREELHATPGTSLAKVSRDVYGAFRNGFPDRETPSGTLQTPQAFGDVSSGSATPGTGRVTVTIVRRDQLTPDGRNLGPGAGSVKIAPPGITIRCEYGSACQSTYSTEARAGSTVRLTAAAGDFYPPVGAGADSYFIGWGGACSGTGSCRVKVTAEGADVQAYFGPASHILTVQVPNPDAGSVQDPNDGIACGSNRSHTYTACRAQERANRSVPLQADSNTAGSSGGKYYPGYTFASWGGDACASTANGGSKCIVLIDRDKTINPMWTCHPTPQASCPASGPTGTAARPAPAARP